MPTEEADSQYLDVRPHSLAQWPRLKVDKFGGAEAISPDFRPEGACPYWSCQHARALRNESLLCRAVFLPRTLSIVRSLTGELARSWLQVRQQHLGLILALRHPRGRVACYSCLPEV